MVGLIPRVGRFTIACLTIAVLAVDGRRAASGSGARTTDLVAGALRLDAFGLAATPDRLPRRGDRRAARDPRARRRGGGPRRLLRPAARLGAGDDPDRPGAEPGRLLRRPRAALDPALRALRLGPPAGALARVRPQVPDHRLDRLGDACSTASRCSTAPRARPTSPGSPHAVGPGGNGNDTLVLIGTAMVATGLAFKTSLAPFHQWTPDVYQGAPTPVTAFMAVATKAAAFIALARLFEVALGPIAHDWKPALAALAVDLDRGRQHRRPRPGLAEAADGLLGHRPGRLHAGRDRGRHRDRARRRWSSTWPPTRLMNLASSP